MTCSIAGLAAPLICHPSPTQFVYVKSSFTPSPDEKIGVLADAFGTVEAGTKKLTVHYALTPAWG